MTDFDASQLPALCDTAIRDLANTGSVTANVAWAVLGCLAVVVVFLPLSVRSYSRKM